MSIRTNQTSPQAAFENSGEKNGSPNSPDYEKSIGRKNGYFLSDTLFCIQAGLPFRRSGFTRESPVFPEDNTWPFLPVWKDKFGRIPQTG